MQAIIVVVAGDGVGPEVTNEAIRVLKTIERKFSYSFTFSHHLIGGIAIDTTGKALPDDTLQAAQSADAVLLGAVGGPKWDNTQAKTRPEDGLLAIRKAMKLYANLRPVRAIPVLAYCSPLRPELLEGVDFMVVRELTGGLYFGTPKERRQEGTAVLGIDTMAYYDYEIKRIMKLAFEVAQGRRKQLASVDKANVLETSRMWREIAIETAKGFPDVTLSNVLVDTAAMRLVMAPKQFDVLVTENTFGDILTDEAAVLTGSMGLLPSASFGEEANRHGKQLGLYEPIHGSAPDIAGKDIANPIGTILSAAMLLRYSLGLENEAHLIETAVEQALNEGCRTADIKQDGLKILSTVEITDEIIKRL